MASESRRECGSASSAALLNCEGAGNTMNPQQIHETRLAPSMDPKLWSQLPSDILVKIFEMRSMDPKLWGHLPNEILVEIYKMLPIKEFSRLRVVCKDWNLVASQVPRCNSND